MNRNAIIGWGWVAAQAVLLGALVLIPTRTDWATPAWLDAFGMLLIIMGLAAIGIAAVRLGNAVTPTPVPTRTSSLKTEGFYRHVRHPIYTGVFAIVGGLTVRSGSWIHLGVAGVCVVFFHRKASWEENLLRDRFDGYDAYARATPKFVPQPWRRLGTDSLESE